MLPIEALNGHVLEVGMTGSGKSFAARGIVEKLLDLGRRVCILDYTGVWWGLRTKARDKGPGYPVVLFGGEHADVPLHEQSGPAVARFVAEHHTPTVIDVDGMTVGAQQRFVTAFLEELYRCNTKPLHLVLEEIDEFAPMTGAQGTERMVGAVARIFQRGRRKGFRAVAITQRPANLHTRVRGQCTTLVAMRLMMPQDRKAVGEWIRGQADADKGQAVIDSLPGMQKGEGWVWSPDQGILKRVQFPQIKTYDSMRAPEDGEAAAPKRWAAVDLESIKTQVAEAVAQAEAEDPKALKRRVAELEGQLRKAAQPSKPTKPTPCDRCAEAIRRTAESHSRLKAVGKAVLEHVRKINLAIADVQGAHDVLVKHADAIGEAAARAAARAADASPPPAQVRENAAAPPAPATPRTRAAPPEGASGRTGAQQRIIDAAASVNDLTGEWPNRAQLGWWARIKPSGGYFNNTIGPLVTAGLFERRGGGKADAVYALTEAGEACCSGSTISAAEAWDGVLGMVSGPQRRCLEALKTTGGWMQRDDLGAAAGIDPKGGYFNNTIGPLVTGGIVERQSGAYRLAEWMQKSA